MDADSSQPPPIKLMLGGPTWWGAYELLAVIPLAAYAPVPFFFLEMGRGVQFTVLHAIFFMSGFGSGMAALFCLILGPWHLWNSFSQGIDLVLDREGIHYRLMFGRVRTARWEDPSLKIFYVTLQRKVPKSNIGIIAHLGHFGHALDTLTTTYEAVTYPGLQVKSAGMEVVADSNDAEMASVRRWLLCREMGEAIAATGGGVTWDQDGFTAVNLAGTYVDDEQFIEWANLLRDVPQLTHINLRGTRLTDAVVPALQELPSLCELDILGSDISPKFLSSILKLPRKEPQPHNFESWS